MVTVPVVPASWLTVFINGFATEPQAVAGGSNEDKAELADQLWSVFARPAAADRTAALNDLLRTCRLTPVIDNAGELHWATTLTGTNDPADLLAAACIGCLLDAVRTLGWSRLGICDGYDCADVYVDQAARTPRRYCSPTCSNRAKIRAYRARQSQ